MKIFYISLIEKAINMILSINILIFSRRVTQFDIMSLEWISFSQTGKFWNKYKNTCHFLEQLYT